MLIDARDLAENHEIEADFVIVGAGTIGLFLASRLAQAGCSVVVVEAGRQVAEPASVVETVGKPHNGARIGRAVGLGGTSTLWGGQLVEFEKRDLEIPGARWLLSYDELLKWYDVTYKALGLSGRYPTEAFQNAFGIKPLPHESIEQFFTSWLHQPNFAVLLKESTARSANVKIVLNATVTAFAFTNDRAVGVHAAVADCRRVTFRGRDFVIAAGTLAGSQLMLQAQRQDGVPWRDNDRVGAYFHDHLGAPIGDLQLQDDRRFRAHFENGFRLGRKLQPKLRFREGALSPEATGVCGFFAFNSSLSEQLANCKRFVRSFGSGLQLSSLGSLASDAYRLGSTLLPVAVRFARERRILALYDRGIQFCVQAEQRPLRESRIRLSKQEAPSNGLPPIVLDWRVDGSELESIRRFARAADSYVQAAQLGRLKFDESFWHDDAKWLSKLADTYHQCGGLRMSSTVGEGVVDPQCRVWNTANVYVAGPAVFPTSSYANTTLTGLALSARLAAALSQQRAIAA